MKILLFLLVVGGLGYVVYAQHQRIESLQAALDQNATQIRELQTKLTTQAAAAPQQAPSFSNPLNNPPPQGQKPQGSTLLDKDHRGPLDR